MASTLGLPQSVRETASVIFRCALDDDLLPGRSLEGVAAAAVYAAARQTGLPRSLDEIAAVARIEYQRIARTYRYIAAELALAVDPADPRDYVPRFASELDCSDEVRQHAHALLTNVAGTPYPSGKPPVSLAAAALYASAQVVDEPLTQDAISEVADVTVVTIREHYRDLLKHSDQQIPD
jgi:transcription initiation factor TFIIB